MKKMKRFDQINVIPFIDIMLVLLVMVLTTATFIKQGVIPVVLPQATESDKVDNKKETTIYVTKEGKIFIEKKEVSEALLEVELTKIPKTQTIVLRSDKDSRFQDFVSVMNILKKLEHKQLFIVTKE
jgi:biopolymer transport protein ExbD